MSIWDSKLIKNIEETGNLPELPISLDNDSIVKIAIALIIVAILTILIAFMFFRHKTA